MEPADIREEFGFKLIHLARRWRMKLDQQMRQEGLTQAQWSTLVYLARGANGMLQKDLACHMGIEGPTLVRLLDNLQQSNLVERRAAVNDRRGKTVHLTSQAYQILTKFEQVAQTIRTGLLTGVSDESLEQCLNSFQQIIDNVNTLDRHLPQGFCSND